MELGNNMNLTSLYSDLAQQFTLKLLENSDTLMSEANDLLSGKRGRLSLGLGASNKEISLIVIGHNITMAANEDTATPGIRTAEETLKSVLKLFSNNRALIEQAQMVNGKSEKIFYGGSNLIQALQNSTDTSADIHIQPAKIQEVLKTVKGASLVSLSDEEMAHAEEAILKSIDEQILHSKPNGAKNPIDPPPVSQQIDRSALKKPEKKEDITSSDLLFAKMVGSVTERYIKRQDTLREQERKLEAEREHVDAKKRADKKSEEKHFQIKKSEIDKQGNRIEITRSEIQAQGMTARDD